MTEQIVGAAARFRPNENCFASFSSKYRLEKDTKILEKILKWAYFELWHNQFGWKIQIGLKDNKYTLQINDVPFDEIDEAPARERAALARTAIIMKMDGPYK